MLVLGRQAEADWVTLKLQPEQLGKVSVLMKGISVFILLSEMTPC